MIRNIHLLIIGMLCVGSFCYSSSSLISDCITYENSSSLKWCRYSNTTSSGYKCTTSEYNSACGGSSSYRCSTDSSYLPSNAKKLLCPEDYSNCYGQTDSLSSYTSSTTFTSGYFGTSTFCWYKVTPNSSSIKSVNVQIITLNNADAEIYYESSTNDYTYKGSVTSGNSLRIDVGYKDPVWILINPTTSSAYASIYVTSSSSTTAELNVDKVQEQVLIPTLIIGTVFILLFVVIIICTGPKSKGNAGVNGDQNGGPATVIQQPSVVAVPSTQSLAVPVPVPSTQPQPQMYSIPQQNANNAFQNQNQIIMNPILHASPQPVNAESQQMYILQPIRNNQPVQMGYSVAQPVALQPNMQQEYKYT